MADMSTPYPAGSPAYMEHPRPHAEKPRFELRLQNRSVHTMWDMYEAAADKKSFLNFTKRLPPPILCEGPGQFALQVMLRRIRGVKESVLAEAAEDVAKTMKSPQLVLGQETQIGPELAAFWTEEKLEQWLEEFGKRVAEDA